MTITAGTADPQATPAEGRLPGGQAAAEVTPLKRLLAKVGSFWTLAIFVLVVVAMGLINHDMFTKAAWLATAEYAVEFAVLAIGETFVMIAGEIDIANGAVLGFSGMAGAYFMVSVSHHMGVGLDSFLGIVVMLAVGAACGLVSGILRVQFKVPSFIVTLGLWLALGYGAINLLTGGFEVGNLPSPIVTLGSTAYLKGWLPLPVLITLVLAVVFGAVLQRTRFGLHTYMLGSSRLASRRAGISEGRHILKCFVFAGIMSGLAGLLVTANLTVASPVTGQNDALYAITGVVIGGASLYGGRGSMFGTFIGVAILAVLTTGLVIDGVSAFWQYVLIGGVLIAAVCIDQVRTRVSN